MTAVLKRFADAFEKVAAGSLLVGFFQDRPLGIWIGIGCLAISQVITWRVCK